MGKYIKMSVNRVEGEGAKVQIETKGFDVAEMIGCLSYLTDRVAEAIELPKDILLKTIIMADCMNDLASNTSKEKAAQSAVTDERQSLN